MKLAYNANGKNRKKMADIIAATLSTEATYNNAPTYSYSIGESFTVTREGELEIDDSAISEEQINAVINALAEAGFDYENSDVVSISYPIEGFTDENLSNLEKMIASKAPLIMKALEISKLPIGRNEEELSFPWFKTESVEEIHAYSQFISLLCETAKSKQRITATAPDEFTNEKFSMRIFCVALGLVGNEYKLCRKLLSNNLEGNSSWRYSAPSGGEIKPRKEYVYRKVMTVRFTPETLEKMTILAKQEGNISRNRLIEKIVEEYIDKGIARGGICGISTHSSIS
jgi:hypothetical protein